jgi:hypothetical protein
VNSDWSYSKHVYLKMFEQASDDEYGFTVEGFKVVDR